MLKVNQSTGASDIWALGCIIYKMLTGREPFQGQPDYYTFQMILARQLSYKPGDHVSPEAKDLIDRLLQLEPTERLGAGSKGNDFGALKAHEFFKGISFAEVNSAKLQIEKRPPVEDNSQLLLQHKDSMTVAKEVKTEGAHLVHEGDLKKRNPYFMNQLRHFKLYSNGKVEYLKDGKDMRGALQLTGKSRIIKTAKDKFEIQNPDRTYFLSEADGDKLSSGLWIEKLEEVISKLS